MAPKHHYSGASCSISINKPIKTEKFQHPRAIGYVIDGTPADCVRIGTLLASREGFVPDLLVSGINQGSNMGWDLFYSGTFGTAR